MKNKVYLGYTTMTHGIKGELKFYPELFEFSEIISCPLSVLVNDEEHVITYIRAHKNHYLITVDHLTDINLVENFRNQKIYMLRELISKPYLISELIGFFVIEGQEELGKVTDIRYNKGGVLLQVSHRFYIPYQSNFIVSVNVMEKRIEVKNTKGLML